MDEPGLISLTQIFAVAKAFPKPMSVQSRHRGYLAEAAELCRVLYARVIHGRPSTAKPEHQGFE